MSFKSFLEWVKQIKETNTNMPVTTGQEETPEEKKDIDELKGMLGNTLRYLVKKLGTKVQNTDNVIGLSNDIITHLAKKNPQLLKGVGSNELNKFLKYSEKYLSSKHIEAGDAIHTSLVSIDTKLKNIIKKTPKFNAIRLKHILSEIIEEILKTTSATGGAVGLLGKAGERLGNT